MIYGASVPRRKQQVHEFRARERPKWRTLPGRMVFKILHSTKRVCHGMIGPPWPMGRTLTAATAVTGGDFEDRQGGEVNGVIFALRSSVEQVVIGCKVDNFLHETWRAGLDNGFGV